VIAGWAEKRGKFDGIYLGREERRKLVYAGKLGRGFTEADKTRMLGLLAKLKTKRSRSRRLASFRRQNG
jgi:hypothetical protein